MLQILCSAVMALESIFTPGSLQHLAGSRFFERGAAYAGSNRVKNFKASDREVTATVRGQRPYQVRLWIEDGGPGFSCTCPVGDEGLFCKHCVAVGLTFASSKHAPHDSDAPDEPGMIDLRSHLHSLPKEALVDLLLEQVDNDEFLRSRLLLDATKSPGPAADLGRFQHAIENAIYVDDFVDYRSMYAYSSGIHKIIETIETLLKDGMLPKWRS